MTDNNNNNIHISNFIRLGELDIFRLCGISFQCWISSRERRNQKKRNPEPGRNQQMINLDLFLPVGP